MAWMLGTSPRAWGKPSRDRCALADVRNIPTCVGKTPSGRPSEPSGPEHPHVRGENLRPLHPDWGNLGTSPRAWGKRRRSARVRCLFRNIPTCVGKTRGWSPRRTPGAEHPHVRGENIPHTRRGRRVHGTSPRAWGKRTGIADALEAVRNIPTCVGKTDRGRIRRGPRAEHPHVRGENNRRAHHSRDGLGTSPRAWGKQ